MPLSITNDAEVQAEFVTKTLSLARLHTRSNVARQEITGLIRLAKNNRSLWGVSAPYAIAFSGISWVLSLLFVLDSQISSTAQPSTVNLILGGNIPSLPDPCRSILPNGGKMHLRPGYQRSNIATHHPHTFHDRKCHLLWPCRDSGAAHWSNESLCWSGVYK